MKRIFSLSDLSRTKWLRLFAVFAVVVAVVASAVLLLTRNTDNVDADEPVATVAITSEGFTPATIKIKKGQGLAWVNNDISSTHEIMADQERAPGLDSAQPLAEGDTYIYAFEQIGTFNYYDPLAPNTFRGTVIVE